MDLEIYILLFPNMKTRKRSLIWVKYLNCPNSVRYLFPFYCRTGTVEQKIRPLGTGRTFRPWASLSLIMDSELIF